MVAKSYSRGRELLFVTALIATAITAAPAGAQTTAIGRLFHNEGTCSAAVISKNNIIVTAAHCCWNRVTNAWIGGWRFVPAYNNGQTPYGIFSWSTANVLHSWIDNGDPAYDVCLIKLKPNLNGNGWPVTFYTGWYGRIWNFPPQQGMRAYGYPGNLGGGNTLQQCAAASSAQPANCGADVLNMACNMTYGSSGGPWFLDYGTSTVGSIVHGWVSATCTGTQGQYHDGPRFTTNNIVPLCNFLGC